MGVKKVELITDAEDQKKAFDHILSDIHHLEKMIDEGLLHRKTPRIGAEQELCLIDEAYRPSPVITEFLKGLDDACFTTELAKFNLEINLPPLELTQKCFSRLEENISKKLEEARERASEINGIDIIQIGILPTIRKMDLEHENLTPGDRFIAMIEAMKWLKKKDYSIRINGIDDLSTTDFSNMFESCNTSFQIHYQLNPDEFAAKYNFAQAIAAPVLAACTNSPILFGKRLWHETRIALFQQAVDTRDSTEHLSQAYLRVPFGYKWIENTVTEVFKDDLAKFKIFLKHNDTEEKANNGEIPELVNLSVFNGSVFRWTRACYGIFEGKPHLRIENRLLPSGPTTIDEVANTAFWIGLMHGMPEKYANVASDMQFEDAKINILKAARYGLSTQFMWLNGKKIKAEKLILDELIPIAREGLKKAAVSEEDIDKYLTIIEERVKSYRTGSQWMLDAWQELSELETADAKATALTRVFMKRSREGKAVHTWALPQEDELIHNQFTEVGEIMSTDIFSVREDDLLDQAVYGMLKKNHGHLPVADASGNLKGLLINDQLLKKICWSLKVSR